MEYQSEITAKNVLKNNKIIQIKSICTEKVLKLILIKMSIDLAFSQC